MKERPILFSAPMVRAILSGSKTQTRRMVKNHQTAIAWLCPYGQPGDRLWVRESFAIETNELDPCDPPFKDGRPVKWEEHDSYGTWWEQAHYAATDPMPELVNEDCRYQKCADNGYCQHWSPSIYMPRWASRITLEIEEVRVGRLNAITHKDAVDEGVVAWWEEGYGVTGIERRSKIEKMFLPSKIRCDHDSRELFRMLWDSINGNREGCSWNDSPWVWVLKFRRI